MSAVRGGVVWKKGPRGRCGRARGAWWGTRYKVSDGCEGARLTRVCPSAVGRPWIAGRRMPSSSCPISKASLGSLAHLRSASVLVVWAAEGKFKDPCKPWEVFSGYFRCRYVRVPFPFPDGEVVRPGGLVSFHSLSIVKINKPEILHPPPHALPCNSTTFSTSFKKQTRKF